MGIGTVQQGYNERVMYAGRKMNGKTDTTMSNFNSTTRTSAKQPLVLNYSDSASGEGVVGAICDARTGISTTVYQPADYSFEQPVYRMKIWNPNGDIEERMIDLDTFNPKNADSFDQYAFSCFAQKEYGIPLTSTLYPTYEVDDPLNSLYEKRDWTSVYKNYMQDQYRAGCFDGYLKYKAIYDCMIDQLGKIR